MCMTIKMSCSTLLSSRFTHQQIRLQTTAVLNFRDQQIEYYDSLGGNDEHTIAALLRWVRDDILDKYGEEATGAFDVRSHIDS